jgi:hypothetical protein
MKTISVQISDADYNTLGLANEQLQYADFKKILKKQIAKEAMENCIKIAKENNFSELTLEEINEEIRIVRTQNTK